MTRALPGRHEPAAGMKRWAMRTVATWLAMAGVCAAGRASRAEPVDDRHGCAIARVPLGDMPPQDDDGVAVGTSFRCPLDGEYSVAVIYDVGLADIDARFPQHVRPRAGRVTAAMNVLLDVTVVDAETGRRVDPEVAASGVFDMATSRRRTWSGERLSAVRLEGGRTYRIAVDARGSSRDWHSLKPLVIVDPSESLAKSLAWRKSLGLP